MGIAPHNYTFEIDDIEEAEWSDLLRQFDDASFYQTWGYGEIQYGARRLTHVVAKRDGHVVAAVQGEIMRIPALKIGIAHFTWGPMWKIRGRAYETDHLRQILRCMFRHYARDLGLLLRIRSYEVEDDPGGDAVSSVYEQEGFHRSKGHHYQTIRVSLMNSLEDLRKNMGSRWRRHLRAAEKKEFTVVQGDSGDLFNTFRDLYSEMYSRKTIVGYNPDIDKYVEVQENLRDHLKFIVLLCEYEGEPVAANVVSALGDTGMYFFGATSDKAIRENLRAAYLLHWRTIQWLKERGYRWYDLRGYDPKRHPGISHFKAGINGDTVGFAEFVGWRNPVSLVAVTIGEGVLSTLNRVTDRLKVIRGHGWRDN
jgi:peptidoglycan pentaglycine glycine transferase (the first glycine)